MVLGPSSVAVTSPSDFAPASSKKFLDIQPTIECGFTLKRVCDMTIGISKDLQKLLKYFNGIAIFTPFLIPLFSVLPIILALYLNEGELLALVTSELLTLSSLLKFHKLPDVSE